MEWTQEEKINLPSKYGCELIYDRASLEQVKDKSLPLDAYIVIYRVDNNTYMDLCRGTRVKIFDLYYDKFGPGSVQKINFGYGLRNPRLWGNKDKTIEKNKRR